MAAWVGALAAAGVHAQDNSTVGPPQLKDFQLPGQRNNTTPRPAGPVDNSPDATPPVAPPPRQAPPTTSPAPAATPQPSPPVVRVAPPAPTAANRTANVSRPEPARTTVSGRPGSADRPVEAAPSAPTATPAPPVTAPGSQAPAPEPGFSAPAPVPVRPEPASSWNSAWLFLPLLVAAIAGAIVWRRRRRDAEVHSDEPEDVEVAAAPPEPPLAPVAAPALPEAENSKDADRASIEVDFKPSRAAATESETIVHYELVLRNVGTAPARNIRIDSKLFNAGSESEIRAFMGGAIHEQSGSPHVAIAPGDELRLGSALAMPRDEVREIVIEGRSLFVPAVAINVAYDWGTGGTARESRSWLVGREAAEPSQKMGAFRMDLGPRIYRSVGARPAW